MWILVDQLEITPEGPGNPHPDGILDGPVELRVQMRLGDRKQMFAFGQIHTRRACRRRVRGGKSIDSFASPDLTDRALFGRPR